MLDHRKETLSLLAKIDELQKIIDEMSNMPKVSARKDHGFKKILKDSKALKDKHMKQGQLNINRKSGDLEPFVVKNSKTLTK